ncbi:MAG: thrombospondin type 3 repeat-containing protein [Anaerolineae bacterium]|nr:thrombospondin type 3 repeat-containing protein [Anaerolineae bacterium]MDW8172123.1 thrombospondin type 3 repeat-containing protein [Anaerolineae bacterium]
MHLHSASVAAMLRLASICLFLGVLSAVSYAQYLNVAVYPNSGPPGTVIYIQVSGGFEGYGITCDIGGVPGAVSFDYYAGGYYTVPSNASGVLYIVCYQPAVPDSGPFAGSAFFTVTAPDRDGDGFSDDVDACPDEFSQNSLTMGCPDDDGDNVINSRDVCPNTFGQAPSGCPDSDGDGFTDNIDACPSEFSQNSLTMGCPDDDADGIINSRDACPNAFGQTPNGCPLDSDQDGIPDSQDACPNAFGQTPNGCPAATPTLIPLSRETPIITPSPTRSGVPRLADFPNLPAFDQCANLRQQANLSITQLIRLSASENPCASLTDLLRRQRFAPNLPSPLSQPRSNALRCSTDPRPVPSADFMALDANFGRMGSAIRLSWAGVSDAELCAAQAGDPFRLADARGVLSPMDRAEYFTASCYGMLTGAQMREALARLKRDPRNETTNLLIASLAGGSLFVQRTVWCSYLRDRVLSLSPSEVEQQNTLLNRLVECRVIQSQEMDIWRARISEGQAGFTWNDLAAYIAYLGRRCMSPRDFLLFIANRGVFLEAVTGLRASVATPVPIFEVLTPTPTPPVSMTELFQTTRQAFVAARCPTDSRSVPTPEMEDLMRLINRLNSNLGPVSDVETKIFFFLSRLSQSGICAFMRGDPFGTIAGMVEVDRDLRYWFWTPTCLGRSYPDDAYRAPDLLSRMRTDSRLSQVVVSVNIANSYAEKSSLWCSYVDSLINGNAFTPTISDPNKRDVLDYVKQCFNLNDDQLAMIVEAMRRNEGYNSPFITTTGTLDDFLSIIDAWRRSNPGRCITGADLRAIVEAYATNRLVTTIRADAALARVSSVFGQVHEVVCERESIGFRVGGRVPQGCVLQGGGTSVAANTSKDRFERGIGGVLVEVYRGPCNNMGALVGTTTTDIEGYFELGELQAVPHCIFIDRLAGANSLVLPEGQWWTWFGSGGDKLYFDMTPVGEGVIASVPTFGWWANDRGGLSQTRMGSGEGDFSDLSVEGELFLADTILMDASDIATPVPGGLRIDFNVYRAYCEPSTWNGTLANIPPGCQLRSENRLIPDGMQQITPGPAPFDFAEPGIASVFIAIYEDECEDGAPDYTITTDADGRGRVILPTEVGGTAYCVVVDAASQLGVFGPGRWVHTSSPKSVSRMIIDGRDYPLGTEFILQWWNPRGVASSAPTPVVVTSAPAAPTPRVPGSVPLRPGGGILPIGPAITPPPPPVGGPAAGPTLSPWRPEAVERAVRQVSQVSQALAAANLSFDNLAFRNWPNTPRRATFIGRGADDTSHLFLLEGGELLDIGMGLIDPVSSAISPDGNMVAYVGHDEDGLGTLYLLDVESGAQRPLFSNSLGIELTDRPMAWSGDGRSLIFGASDESGESDLFQLDASNPDDLPRPFIDDASDPAITPDGLLLAFVRDGAVYVRFVDTGDEYPVTEPGSAACEQPFFDENGIDLYFICRDGDTARLFLQGTGDIREIETSPNLVYAGPGPESGTIIWNDSAVIYLANGDGSNAAPLLDVPQLRISGLRWGG